MSATCGGKLNPQLIDLSRYSSFVNVLRITAHVKRFIRHNRRRKAKMEMKIAPLGVQKIQEAKLTGIKSAQRAAFPADTCNLTAGNPIGMKSRLKTLTPFLNESDILRAAGRIDCPAVSYDVKHPMIIARNHQLCPLEIMDCHKKLNHEGTEHVRNDLRLLYRILHSRSTARKALNDRHYAAREEESSHNLP